MQVPRAGDEPVLIPGAAASTAAREIDPAVLSTGLKEPRLCTRCGTCTGICPTGAISVGPDGYPRLDPSLCTSCGLCNAACPGDKVEYRALSRAVFGEDSPRYEFDGRVNARFVAHATDERIRNGGAGGGVITALLWDLLKHGDVRGCIVTRMAPGRPWVGEYFIARTYEELLASQGSRYTIIPVNAVFQEIRELEGPFAYAPLPCQAHGFRYLARENPELGARIHSVIGLFCGGALEPELVTDLLRSKGIRPEDLADFEFRGGDWPGKMRAELKDGTLRELHYSNYKDGAYNYFTGLYMPERCQTCIDGSGLMADLSIGDAWTRDREGNYAYPRHSRVLVRNERGMHVLEQAIQRGSLVAHDVSSDPNYQTHRIQTKRKGTLAPVRVERWGRAGRPVPRYDVDIPGITPRDRLLERVVSTVMRLARWHWLRYGVLSFVTSRGGLPIIWYRQWAKRRKYRKMRA